MMNQFVVKYIFGGMSLNHSGWWLCEEYWKGELRFSYPLKMLKRSDYK